MVIDGLIAHYGLAAIFLGAATEGEAAAIAGGIVAHRHLIPLWHVASAVYLGSLLFAQGLFLLSRRFRTTPWVVRQVARLGYAAVMRALERRPTAFLLIYRFVFGVRTLTPLVLGGSGISTTRFTLLNALSALIWSAVFTGLGYGFGRTVERWFGRLPSGHHLIMIGLVIAVIVIIAWLVRQRLKRRAPRDASRF